MMVSECAPQKRIRVRRKQWIPLTPANPEFSVAASGGWVQSAWFRRTQIAVHCRPLPSCQAGSWAAQLVALFDLLQMRKENELALAEAVVSVIVPRIFERKF